MSKLNEVIDSITNENAEEVKKQLTDEAIVLSKANSDLYKRAKKAEGFEYKPDSKEWVKKEVKPEVKPEAKPEPTDKSSEPDYAKLSFLEGRKVDNPDDQQIVLSEAERLKLPLTDVLEMEHIKSKLKDAKDQRESTEGMPKGSGKGTGKTRNDVDYYTSKPQKADGTYETPADLDLADKVIEARMQKEKQGNQFSEELYTG